MKKDLFVLAILAILFWSCSKKPSESPIAPQLNTTFKFTGNGTFVEWNGYDAPGSYPVPQGSNIQKYNYNGSSYYMIVAHSAGAGLYSPAIYLKLETNNLIQGSYSKTLTAPVSPGLAGNECTMPGASGIHGTTSEVGDYVSVNITSIHDNIYADGTFTALMTNSGQGTATKLTITNGEFHNVKITQ